MTKQLSDRTVVYTWAGVVLTAFILGWMPWSSHRGATGAESSQTMPGDGLVPAPRYQTTRAITIQATSGTVWAWLIQLGQGRGGFYTFDWLENLAGLGITSADRIVPAWQGIATGDTVPLSASGGPTVVEIVPERTFVLHFVMDPFTAAPVKRAALGNRRWLDWTWAFTLRPDDREGTRLVVRTRADYAPHLPIALLMTTIVKPIHLLMEQGMLRGIRRRAERAPSALVTELPA